MSTTDVRRVLDRLTHERNSLKHRRARLLAEVNLVERRLVGVEAELAEAERQTAPPTRNSPATEKPEVAAR
jgi:hypothetical protein